MELNLSVEETEEGFTIKRYTDETGRLRRADIYAPWRRGVYATEEGLQRRLAELRSSS